MKEIGEQGKYLEMPDGRKLYYETIGEGKPILFIHGNTLDRRMWDPQVDGLKDHHQLILPDLPGFGKSEAPKTPYARHGDLRYLLEQLNISKITLVGLSLGGDVVLDFALEYPDMVENLILIDSGIGGWSATKDFEDRWNEVLKIAKEVGMKEAKELWLTNPLFAGLKDTKYWDLLVEMVDDYSGYFWFNPNPRIRPAIQAIKRLHEIDIPTLILIGENDGKDFQEIATLLASEIRSSRRIIIEGAGHMSNLEKPEVVNEEIVRFLGS